MRPHDVDQLLDVFARHPAHETGPVVVRAGIDGRNATSAAGALDSDITHQGLALSGPLKS